MRDLDTIREQERRAAERGAARHAGGPVDAFRLEHSDGTPLPTAGGFVPTAERGILVRPCSVPVRGFVVIVSGKAHCWTTRRDLADMIAGALTLAKQDNAND